MNRLTVGSVQLGGKDRIPREAAELVLVREEEAASLRRILRELQVHRSLVLNRETAVQVNRRRLGRRRLRLDREDAVRHDEVVDHHQRSARLLTLQLERALARERDVRGRSLNDRGRVRVPVLVLQGEGSLAEIESAVEADALECERTRRREAYRHVITQIRVRARRQDDIRREDHRSIGRRESDVRARTNRRIADDHLIRERRLVRRNIRATIRDDEQFARILRRALVNDRSRRKLHHDRTRHLPTREIDRFLIRVANHNATVNRSGGEPFLEIVERRLRVRNAGVERGAVADLLLRIGDRVRDVEMCLTRHDVVVPDVVDASGHRRRPGGSVTPHVDRARVRRAMRPLLLIKRRILLHQCRELAHLRHERHILLLGAWLLQFLIHQRAETAQVESAELRTLPHGFEAVVAIVAGR